MKVSLSVLGFFAASVHATTSNPHPEDDAAQITVLGLLAASMFDTPICVPGSTCELPNFMGYCNARPSQQATVLGATQCMRALRNKRPEDLIALTGTKTQRVEDYTSRDKSLGNIITVLGVRSANGLGKTVSRRTVAKMVDAVVAGCIRPDCEGGRCPISVVSAELDGNVEVWIWGERDEVEWEPEAKLGPSAAVTGDKMYGNGYSGGRKVRAIKSL